MTHTTSFTTSSKSDLFREHPTCWNPSRPRILFSEWCQQCTPNVPRMMPQEQPRENALFLPLLVEFRFHMRLSQSWYQFIQFCRFLRSFSDTEETKTGFESGETSLSFIIIHYPSRITSTKTADAKSMSLSSRFAWKQWNTNLQLPSTNTFTADEHLAAPCHPCGCCRPCATMYQYLQYGHLHFILSASF